MSELDELVKKIAEKTSQPPEKIFEAIEAKQDELSGLVSKEGAAHLVAMDFGLNLLKDAKKDLKIANLVEGLGSVDLSAKIMDMVGPREIEKNGKRYRVLNITLGDSSGVVRLALWDKEIEFFNRIGLIKGDWIKIMGGYCKQARQGVELRLGRGRIEKTEGGELPEANTEPLEKAWPAKKMQLERKKISELKEGDFAEIKAAVLQLFTKNPFFEVCGQCGSKMSDGKCKQHGQAEPVKQLVLSGALDDGSGTIRGVFFRKVAEQLVGPTEKIQPDFVFDGLGKEMIIKGRVKKNDFTKKLEFIANDIQEMDVKSECQKLMGN